MQTIIRNKITIIPSYPKNSEKYKNEINIIGDFCCAMEDGIKKIVAFTKIAPKPVDLIEGTKEEDDWLLNNWGCRDKALNSCWISDNEIIFDTFFNPAIPIILKIAKQFSDTSFFFKFSSKSTGSKSGELIIHNGTISFINVEKPYSKRAYEIAFELMPHLRMLYTFNNKTFTYEYDTSDFDEEISKNGFYKSADGTILIGCDDKKKPLFDDINDLPF